MNIVYHFGAHCTDDDALLRCLLKNRGLLTAEGIAVPGPTRYRTLLRETAAALRGQNASAETEQMVLDEIVEEDGADRLILSFDSFLAYPQWALARSRLYPAAADRSQALARIFPGHDVEFHLAIRNPATFLPALLAKQKGKSYEDFIEGSDPMLLRWSDLVMRLREANPEVPLTVWCDEDTPLIWPEVLQAVAGHAPQTRLEGEHDVAAAIMAPEGLARMLDYLASHPPQTGNQRRRIVSAFLDKFALPDEIEVELDLPGWTEAYVEALTGIYDADVAAIAGIPGVRLIAP